MKNFQDFLDFRVEADEFGSYGSYVYRTSYFTDMIIVEDFDSFNQPLRYGNYPDTDTEVLIYDYMAFQLMETHSLTNVDTMQDLIDYVLIDKDTGLQMKIAGILKSDYEKFAYADGE